jgi:DNA-binding beta-propeller fold protein YncE
MRPALSWVAVIGLIFAGCSTSHLRGTSAQVAIGVAQMTEVRCGEAPVLGRLIPGARRQALNLPGMPDGIATTPNGRTSLVALQSGAPRIAVIDNAPSGQRLLRTISLPTYASGMTMTRDGAYALAAEGHGAVVVDVAAARSGASKALLGYLTAPRAGAGSGPGAAEVAVSPDSRYAFVTLEGAGVVAVFDLHAAIGAGFTSTGSLGSIPVGAGALGIVVSPDGRWLYEVSETGLSGSSPRKGVLNVIDSRLAILDPAKSVLARAAVPCAPVRIAVAPDSERVWVTARGGNVLLGFSASALRQDPAHALVSVTRVGEEPLGVAVADGGRKVLVADSNLGKSPLSRSAVSIIDTSSRMPALLGSIPVGQVADAISAPSTGQLAGVTSSASRQLELLSLRAIR